MLYHSCEFCSITDSGTPIAKPPPAQLDIEEMDTLAAPAEPMRLRTYSSSSQARNRLKSGRYPNSSAGRRLTPPHSAAATVTGYNPFRQGTVDALRMSRLEALKGRVLQRSVSECSNTSQGSYSKAVTKGTSTIKPGSKENVGDNPSPV